MGHGYSEARSNLDSEVQWRVLAILKRGSEERPTNFDYSVLSGFHIIQ